MPVAVHRDLDGGVTHLLFDVHRALTLLEQQRGEAVPQVMEPHLTQPRLLEQPVKDPIADVVGMEQPHILVTENPCFQHSQIDCETTPSTGV